MGEASAYGIGFGQVPEIDREIQSRLKKNGKMTFRPETTIVKSSGQEACRKTAYRRTRRSMSPAGQPRSFLRSKGIASSASPSWRRRCHSRHAAITELRPAGIPAVAHDRRERRENRASSNTSVIAFSFSRAPLQADAFCIRVSHQSNECFLFLKSTKLIDPLRHDESAASILARGPADIPLDAARQFIHLADQSRSSPSSDEFA